MVVDPRAGLATRERVPSADEVIVAWPDEIDIDAGTALVSLVHQTKVTDHEVVSLRDQAEKAALTRRPELFRVVPLQGGASSLRDAIAAAIGATR